MADLSSAAFFSGLPEEQRHQVEESAEFIEARSGDILFYEGDTADFLYLLISGRVALQWGENPRGLVQANQLLDPAASLSGLPHGVKAIATTDSQLLRWSVDSLQLLPDFDEASRRYLGGMLRQTQNEFHEVAAPIHYQDNLRAISPGPFIFEDTLLTFAFCDADLDAIQALIPEGLTLLRMPGRKRAPIFIGLAEFSNGYPEGNPDARFSYTETTIFIPVRFGNQPGVFIPYIYPSSWEPILVGREVYGFPKRLGMTTFSPQKITLHVDQEEHLSLEWEGLKPSSESALVGGLMDWLGIQRHLASAAFQASEVLRKTLIGGPAYRRVDVFNRKRTPSVASTVDAPLYDIDQLTHAVFGVLRWFQIDKVYNPRLTILNSPLGNADVHLHEAYRTRLDMRLSAGEVVHDYGKH